MECHEPNKNALYLHVSEVQPVRMQCKKPLDDYNFKAYLL